METTFFEKVLSENASQFAYLDDQLRIVSHSSQFERFAEKRGSLKSQPITAVFRETIGLETVLEQLISSNHGTFLLENLNREFENGDLGFFNLSFFATGDAHKPLFCMIQEVTEKAELMQSIRQKENQLLLLESMLSAQNSDAAVSFLGNSPAVQRIRRTIEKIARIPTSTILLHGESGTGKSMVARTIHHAAFGKSRPFVEINCAAIPEALLESELFGYEKGAFTNAIASKPGLLEEAGGGTLFLDEISEMSPKLQAKLLSFLETRRFRRLGSVKDVEVNLRVITATNRDLTEMVRENDFREDLLYRLNVVNIELPPLREMGDDILMIARHFVNIFNKEFRKQISGFTPDAESNLRNYNWPGNVRELRNAIERAMIFVEENIIDAPDIQLGNLRRNTVSADPLASIQLPPDGVSFEAVERKLLQDALDKSNGNQSQAARLLHLTRDAFRYRLEKHDLL